MKTTATAEAPQAKRKPFPKQPPNNLSRVTSGNAFFVVGDGRSAWGRRFKDLIYLHCEDLGGWDNLSEFQLSLVRRVASLECVLEKWEAELAEGAAVDIDVYARVASHLRRIVETLGLKRVVRDREPPLVEIITKHNSKEAKERAS